MFDEFKKEFFYAGEFAKQLDEKRRVSFPTKWRFAGDEDDNSYLAIVQDDEYISILPPKEMALMREKISQVSKKNKVKQTAIRKMMKDSYTFGCDKHGRIMFTEAVLKRVGIDKEICLVGNGNTFEVWNPEKYKQVTEGTAQAEDENVDYDEVLEEMGF